MTEDLLYIRLSKKTYLKEVIFELKYYKNMEGVYSSKYKAFVLVKERVC